MIKVAIDGRSRRLRELSVIQAFDQARIRTDVENNRPKPLAAYLDELRPASERIGSSAGFFAWLDTRAAITNRTEMEGGE